MIARCAVVACTLVSASPAAAATYVVRHTGTVLTGLDETGVFGGGIVLTGQSFVSEYRFLYPSGAIYTSDGTTVNYYGGTAHGVPSPMSGTITINQVTVSISGNIEARLRLSNDLSSASGPSDILHYTVFHYYADGQVVESSHLTNALVANPGLLSSTDITAPLDYALGANDFGVGSFRIGRSGVGVFEKAEGRLQSNHITVSLVPDISTWTALVAGFAVVGGAMRRRRKHHTLRLAYA